MGHSRGVRPALQKGLKEPPWSNVTEELLDQTRKFVVIGPDERIWYFAYESQTKVSIGTTWDWNAYSKRPDSGVYIPHGIWAEHEVLRYLTKHSRKLTDSDRIDLYFFLHKGGIETYLTKHRMKETHDSRR